MDNLILVINTGSTSTKIGLFDSDVPMFVESIKHSDEDLTVFPDINSQKDFRQNIVLDFLKTRAVSMDMVSAIAARGGLLKPLESGTYLVDEQMVQDLIEAKRGSHASHLSAQIGYSLAMKFGISCYIVDPVSVDEFDPIARYSGHKKFERIMLTHALNMKAVAKNYAKENNKDYSQVTVIVVHLGTGISISVHKNGRMIDAINPTEEGPFSPDRSGGLPVLQVAEFIIQNKMDFKSFSRMVFGDGGLFSYLKTRDFSKVEEMYKNGDKEVAGVVQAMAYQIAKEVGALSTVVKGNVEAILITGGMARADFFVDLISERIKFIAPIRLYPGEDEIRMLAEGVNRILKNEEKAKKY